MDIENFEQKNALILNDSRKMNKRIVLVRDVALVLAFAILTGLSAGLKIEIGAVPVTMQTFVVLLSGALLGSKRGAASQISYMLLGLSGLPWFSRGGGAAYIMSPTFGYILGFVLAACVAGLLFEKGWDENIKKSILAMTAANFALYVPGLLWLAKFVGFSKVLNIGFYPFVLGDAVKIFLAAVVLFSNSEHKRTKN